MSEWILILTILGNGSEGRQEATEDGWTLSSVPTGGAAITAIGGFTNKQDCERVGREWQRSLETERRFKHEGNEYVFMTSLVSTSVLCVERPALPQGEPQT